MNILPRDQKINTPVQLRSSIKVTIFEFVEVVNKSVCEIFDCENGGA
jgi:hypothetical protein